MGLDFCYSNTRADFNNFFGFRASSEKYYGRIIPARIVIDGDSMVSEGESFCVSRSVSQVKKVVDAGAWYHIYFAGRNKSLRFVCQKDLLVQGTLEEFEKLFEHKIVKI